MAEIAVQGALTLVEIVSSFIYQEINLKQDVQNDVACIRGWLGTMQAFLLDEEGEQRTEVVRDQLRQIRDIAYDMEDIIYEFMFRVPHHFHRHRVTQIAHNLYHYLEQRDALYELSSRIQDIRKKMENFGTMNPLRISGMRSGEASRPGTTLTSHSSYLNSAEDEVVGFQRLMERILNQLLSEEPRRFTVSIVGPAGSGKTVLAKKVFEAHRVRGVFDFIFLVRVSCPFDLEDLLRNIELQLLGQLENDPLPLQGTRLGLRERLKRQFKDRKYLIFLDDVWRKQDWGCILNELPIGAQGSRVIVTSCNRDVASFCVHEPGYLHELNGLSWKDARNLFCNNAFQRNGGECPPALEEWAEKIVKKCEGLPLAIKTVGSLLSKKPPIPIEWKKIHDSIGTDLLIIRSLLPSYNDLRTRPDLKSCFFYFGIFPEDYSIRRERLIRLWIAEGFVKRERNKSLDEVAEHNLNELVDRNLVSVSNRDIDGRVKSCRVLNLVREFIISKAEEENFVQILTGERPPSSEKVRRLSLTSNSPTFSSNENFHHARSAFFFGKVDFCSFITLFKLLRVLDMKGAPLESFPEVVLGLRLLRYLSLQSTRIRWIPGSIKRLSLLETLDLKQTLITQLPNSIFRLHYLRHLLVYHYEFDNYVTFEGVKGVEIGDGIGTLTSIEKLSLIKVNSQIIKELGELVHLRKLGIIGLKQKDGKRICEALQKMPDLSILDIRSEGEDVPLDLENIPDKPAFEFLQRLYLKGRLLKLPRWVSSLQSLIKIHLKWSRMEASPLEALQNLPSLMELQMVDSYTGDCLEFKAGTFGKLKELVIEQFGQLNMVIVQESAMPELQILRIRKCENLSILPLGIERLSRLGQLILHDMNDELVDRVKHEDSSIIEHIAVVEIYDLGRNQPWSRRNTS